MRILLFGSDGGLGRTFQDHRSLFEPSIDWSFLNRTTADVTNPDQIQAKLEAFRPDVVINASGYTAVDKAESEREAAFHVNTEAVGHLTHLCAEKKIIFVTYSTDYVFDGTGDLPLKELDTPNPQSAYGKTKLAGEKLALDYPNSIVIRTSWLYSEKGKSFPKSILQKALKGEALKIVDDQWSSPTWALDLALATMKLIDLQQKGLFHYSSQGATNWWEVACHTIETYNRLKGTQIALPEAIKTKDLPLAAPRPTYSLLNCDRIRKRGIMTWPWRLRLERYLGFVIHSLEKPDHLIQAHDAQRPAEATTPLPLNSSEQKQN